MHADINLGRTQAIFELGVNLLESMENNSAREKT
jgi:hypothetical protein